MRRLFQVPMPWGHASSGHTKTYETNISESDAEGQGHYVRVHGEGHRLAGGVPFDRTAQTVSDQGARDAWVAYHLYVRNMEISASLYGVVHVLEVGLRNRVHSKMTDALKSEEWWNVLPLHEQELNDIAEARENIANRVQQVRPGRIIAELNFGFWVKLFANTYEKTLWVPHLTQLFPARISRKALHERLSLMKEIRNRIAHHETLILRDPKRDYEAMLETIGWLSPTLRRWVEHHTDFPQVVERRIPKRGKAGVADPLPPIPEAADPAEVNPEAAKAAETEPTHR